ncbi:hypothetical protein FRC04_010978 [Tulasnella sp. 424]|nr:hypothetical protein FRC04_010978 [Tulasnella sp. 424]KAG8972140.1 hypothetical protein FRC05_010308 [Tulasnella sp. 425]
MKVLAFGASKNVGYYASTAMLKSGHTVIFQLRNPSAFDQDEELKPVWAEATADNIPVDVILFAVGGTPKFTLSKAFIIDPPNICFSALLNVLSVIPRSSPQPRLIALTSNGVTSDTHNKNPLAIRASYALIQGPHADKLGMERLVQWSAGWLETSLGGKEGWLQSAVVVGPAVFTDGPEKGVYKVGEDVSGLLPVSLRDVAHFIVNDLVKNWENWQGKRLAIGY